MSVKRLTFDAALLALLIISAFISIPVSEISFTLQVLVVILISLITKPKDSFLIIVLYFIMGLIGIPVFSQGGGFAYILKPSFGYLLGFIFVPLIRFIILKIKLNNKVIENVISSIICLLFIYLFGSIYFIFIMKNVNGITFNIQKTLAMCVIPFIPFDILKIITANLISIPLNNIIKNDKEEIIRIKNRRHLSSKIIRKINHEL